MRNSAHYFRCLYYPFSRLLDEATLKYLLLVFDSIAFIDDVDPEWRSYQLKLMSRENPTFTAYESLKAHYGSLDEENIVQILDARDLKATRSQEIASATLADLADSKFVEIASSPAKYGLPARPLGAYGLEPIDQSTWQMFYGKLAKPLVETDYYLCNPLWRSHILVPGTKQHHWTLTYEAGSSAALNFYLGAAEELQLTPVTTSPLHHELVLRKLKRIFADDESGIETVDDHDRRRFGAVMSQGEILRLFRHLFPVSLLAEVSFDDIVRFRDSSALLRREFVREVEDSVRLIGSHPASADYDCQVVETMEKMRKQFESLNDELAGIRDKIFPSLAKALTFGAASGSALGAGVTFLGGLSLGGLIAASALPVASSLLISVLELWNEKRALLRAQLPSVTYLASIAKMTG